MATTSAPRTGVQRHMIRSAADVLHLLNTVASAPTTGSAKRRAQMIILLALGGVFVDAYDFTSLGIGAVQLKEQFHLSGWQLGMMTASMAFTACLGALFGGFLVDKLGRLPMFLLDLYFFVVAAIGASLAPNVWVLVGFRLLMGLGVGLDFPVALSFVAEFTALRRKGRSVNLSYINWYMAAITGFIVTLLGYELGAGPNLWRYAVGFGAVPAVVILLLRFRYMFESPMWLAQRGDLAGAAGALKKVYAVNAVAPKDGGEPGAPMLSLRDIYRILFSPLYRPRAVIAGVTACFQSIEYYAVVFFLPVISQVIFGHTLLNAIIGGIFFSLFGLGGSLIQAYICDRTGIRPLNIIGASIAAVACVGIGFFHAHHLIPITATMVALFMIGHTVGPGPQGMAYGTLSFPTEIRGTAVGYTQGMLRVGSITGFFFSPVLVSAVGFDLTFPILAAAPIVILIATLLIRWEPIGRDADLEAMDVAAAGTTIELPAAVVVRSRREVAGRTAAAVGGGRHWVSLELPIKVLVDTLTSKVERVIVQDNHVRLARDYATRALLLDEQLGDLSHDADRWRESLAVAEGAPWPPATRWERTHLELPAYLASGSRSALAARVTTGGRARAASR